MKRAKILVVDDEPHMVRAIEFHLKKSGYEVATASDGDEALDTLSIGEPPDLIIADIMMPRMDGYELCSRVRNHPEYHSIPFVFLSAKADKRDQLEGRELGADDYLTKPFGSDELLITVRTRLKRTEDIKVSAEQKIAALKDEVMRKVSAELREKIEHLETLVRKNERLAAIGETVSCVVHDLKGPLTSIMGFAELLDEPLDAGETSVGADKRKEYCGVIFQSACKLNERIQDLLKFSGEITPDLKAEAINPLIERTIASMGKVFEDHHIGVELALEQRLPSAMIDRGLMSDVFFNLFQNALQAMEGWEGGKLRVSTRRGGDAILIKVEDTGVGIPEENLDKLFDLFFTTRSGGTGLGLANVKKIVEGHRGTIEVQSTLGEGTTFWITLPVAV